jgi:hypothetical protein
MQREGVVFRPLSPPVLELANAVTWRQDHDNPAIANLEKALEALVDAVA